MRNDPEIYDSENEANSSFELDSLLNFFSLSINEPPPSLPKRKPTNQAKSKFQKSWNNSKDVKTS